MKITRPLLLTCLSALLLPGCAPRPAPEKIVQDMLKAYAGLRSYEDHCDTTAQTEPGVKPQVVMQEQFAYQAPNRFLIGIHSGDRAIAVAWSDGKVIKSIPVARGMGFSADAPPALGGSEALFSKLNVPMMNGPLSFLVGANPLGDRTARLGDDETLDGQPMYVVEVGKSDGVRLWIGQKDHLLHRVERSVPSSRNGMPITEAVTDTRTGISVNQAVPEEHLSFNAPRGFPMAFLPELHNRPAPPVRLTTLDGQKVSLESLRGKVVVLDFWAYWCGPCRQELPSLQKLYEDLRSRGVVVYGVTQRQPDDPDWKKTRSAIDKLGLKFPTLVDGDGSLARAYGAVTLPHTFVIDRQGMVRADLEGARPEEEIRDELARAGA